MGGASSYLGSNAAQLICFTIATLRPNRLVYLLKKSNNAGKNSLSTLMDELHSWTLRSAAVLASTSSFRIGVAFTATPLFFNANLWLDQLMAPACFCTKPSRKTRPWPRHSRVLRWSG